MAMAKATAFLFLLMAIPAALATQYTVGDSSGWNQGVDYTTWTSGKTFAVGDSLVFNYGGLHGVDVVSTKSDYDSCNTGSALKSYSDGATTINLSQPGPMYFICPTAGHCSGGMKLSINVVAASTAPAGNTNTPTTPTTPSGSTTPAATDTPSGSTTPAATDTPSTTKSPNGAASILANINVLVFGSLLVFAFLG